MRFALSLMTAIACAVPSVITFAVAAMWGDAAAAALSLYMQYAMMVGGVTVVGHFIRESTP